VPAGLGIWRTTLKRLAILFLYLTSTLAFAQKTVSSVSISPQGAVLQNGSNLQFSVTCHYTDSSSDGCSNAGGARWSAGAPSRMTVSAAGLATWVSDPGSGCNLECAFANVAVSAGGVNDRAIVIGQHVGDTFYEYPTPDINNFKDQDTFALQTLTVAVGAQIAVGTGIVINDNSIGNHTGVPFSPTCSWSSSDTGKAIVDRHGLVTAIAPGVVTITCGRSGNGVYGSSTGPNWVSPGNNITLTVQPGGNGTATWYVRPNGGSIFVNGSQTPAGQCDGKHDADYPGSGINQPCAVNNLRDLWADGVTPHELRWYITGGDTIIVRQKSTPYNMNLDQASPYQTPAGSAFVPTNCGGNPFCYMPPVPSGTASKHTRILGENFGSCHADSAKTLLNVSYNGATAFNVKDSQFVDVACFEITDQAACSTSTNFTNVCHGSNANFGYNGILQSALTSYVNYTDIFIHGLGGDGIGGAAGVGVVGNYLHIRGAPDAGINLDDNTWESGSISVSGGFTLNNSITEFTGCVEEYPVVHNYPFIECRDQNLGGYADAFGTGSTTGAWSFDHDIWRYNFQDGLDLLHSGMQSLSVTNSQSYGNDGQAYKIGPADTVVFRNNLAIEDCARIGQAFGDEPSSAVSPGVALCRAAGDWMPMQFSNQGSYILQNNTFAGYGATVFDFGCSNGWDTCNNASAVFQNNVVMGYTKSNYDGGQAPGLFYESSGAAVMPPLAGWSVRDHNFFYGVRYCPWPLGVGETCNTTDPKFLNQPGSPIASETALDSFNYTPSAGSPLLGAGVRIAGLVTDILGNSRPSNPSIGAMDISGAGAPRTQQSTSVTLAVTPTSANVGTSVTLSAAASPAGSLFPTGMVTFMSGGAAIGSAALNSTGATNFTSSSMPAGTYNVIASYAGDSNFTSATSSSSTVIVTASPTSKQQADIVLFATPNPAAIGQNVTFTAAAAIVNGLVPSGSITFTLNGTSVSGAINGKGLATASISAPPTGSFSATAAYAGDATFNSASSTPITVTVNGPSKQASSVGLSATPSPATTTQPITLTATVQSVGGVIPTGNVTFSINNTTVSAALSSAAGSLASLLPSGTAGSATASVSIPTITSAGTYSATAIYGGDTNFGSGAATPVSVSVGSAASAVGISISQPVAGFNVLPGSVRRIFAQVANGASNQVTWTVKSGSAQVSANSGSWVDITAGSSGSSCQFSNAGQRVYSATQFTIEATSVDDGSKKADVTFSVCNPAVQVSTIPAYRTLYANQTADVQSLVVGSVNDAVQWSITSQPTGGDGRLADSTSRDTVFSATAPGRYTLTATSVANSGQTASSILYVTGHSMPYRVTPNLTEPVDCSVDPALLGNTYDVGPSQTYRKLRDLPLNNLLNGSTIRLHNEDTTGSNPTTFNEYVQISQHAAPDQPVRLCGLPDSAGNLPILDAANAIGRSDTTASAAGNGLITVGGSTSGAAWPSFNGAQNILIEGLHLRNARAGVAYTTPAGGSATWQSSAACIRVGDGHNITLIGDEMDSCSNGAASLWNGTTWGGSSLNHLWEGNYVHGNGTAGSSSNHQMDLQAWGQVVQFNRIDRIAAGTAGANLKSRGIQDVIRYNYFGDGAARDLDLVDVGSAAQFMSFGDFFQNNAAPTGATYSMDQLAAWQEAWNSHFAYGNIYLNSTSTAPIHFAYDQSGAEAARKGNLYWYNNTFYETLCSTCSGKLFTMFDTSAGGGSFLPQTEFQTVQAFNNILWMDSTSQPTFQWNNFDAFIGVGGGNILPAAWGANTMSGRPGDGWDATGNAAAYQNAGSLSLHITGFSASSIQTVSSLPFEKTSWTLANASPETTNVPSEVCSMPTRFAYLPSLGYAIARPAPPNIGATDTSAQTAAVINLVGGTRQPGVQSICR